MSNSDGPTIVRDLDAEILLRHFCLETEAELVVNWCSKHSARSATDPNERITRALELKEKGNLPTDEYVESIPIRETRGYVKRVLSTYQTYRYL